MIPPTAARGGRRGRYGQSCFDSWCAVRTRRRGRSPGTPGLYCLEAGFYLTGKAGEATGKTLRDGLTQTLDAVGKAGVAAGNRLAEAVKKDKGDLVISDMPVRAA